MRMDGDVVEVGNSVYDMVYATGKVVSLHGANSFLVSFTDGRTHTYGVDGRRARVSARTLYWKDPVVAIPSKSDLVWSMTAPIIRSIVDVLRTHV